MHRATNRQHLVCTINGFESDVQVLDRSDQRIDRQVQVVANGGKGNANKSVKKCLLLTPIIIHRLVELLRLAIGSQNAISIEFPEIVMLEIFTITVYNMT